MAFGHLHKKMTIYRHLKPEKVILTHKVMETKNLDCSKNVLMMEQSRTHFVEE
uniref:Protein kinase domain-containing protein n=1 Tax=Moschus moschiferus TaxID=68415 RepID=A0A8C6DMF9_MOSMO